MALLSGSEKSATGNVEMEIYTIGDEGLDQRRFLSILNGHEISVVADVGQLPPSRKKGFSKKIYLDRWQMKISGMSAFQDLEQPKRCEMKSKRPATTQRCLLNTENQLSVNMKI